MGRKRQKRSNKQLTCLQREKVPLISRQRQKAHRKSLQQQGAQEGLSRASSRTSTLPNASAKANAGCCRCLFHNSCGTQFPIHNMLLAGLVVVACAQQMPQTKLGTQNTRSVLTEKDQNIATNSTRDSEQLLSPWQRKITSKETRQVRGTLHRFSSCRSPFKKRTATHDAQNEHSMKFSTLCSPSSSEERRIFFVIRRHSFHSTQGQSKTAHISSSPWICYRWHTLTLVPDLPRFLPMRP